MKKDNIILLTEKKWHRKMFDSLQISLPQFNWILIDQKNSFNLVEIQTIQPIYIFIPHWSYIIPKDIFSNYKCIVFHMTDLPFGRGGSPLQNLIVRKYNETKISAIEVINEVDAGPIYSKKELSLHGAAHEIFERTIPIIQEMIIEIVQNNPTPIPQEGTVEIFKRRTPEESNIEMIENIDDIYDYIRMLDAEGYPHAYIESKYFRFEFTKADNTSENEITAHVRIIKK